jgi:hypothetical protein
MTAITI